MKKRTITLFRHGQTAYAQGNATCSVEDANDLCAKPLHEGESLWERQERAVAEVRKRAQQLAAKLDKSVPVFLLSSPTGRALHTAKVIAAALEKERFTVVSIRPHPNLLEVANFSWSLFEPLMNGGVVTYEDGGKKEFKVDKAETNPQGLEYPTYFIEDAAHSIAPEHKAKWPEAYRQVVEKFEKFKDVTHRFMVQLNAINTSGEEGQFILVSHDCMAMHLADKFTAGRQKGLTPGDFIHMVRDDNGRLLIKQVGDITDGDGETDFVASWFEL